jgi:hypothetical protein
MQSGFFFLNRGQLSYKAVDLRGRRCHTCNSEWVDVCVLNDGGITHVPDQADGVTLHAYSSHSGKHFTQLHLLNDQALTEVFTPIVASGTIGEMHERESKAEREYTNSLYQAARVVEERWNATYGHPFAKALYFGPVANTTPETVSNQGKIASFQAEQHSGSPGVLAVDHPRDKLGRPDALKEAIKPGCVSLIKVLASSDYFVIVRSRSLLP